MSMSTGLRMPTGLRESLLSISPSTLMTESARTGNLSGTWRMKGIAQSCKGRKILSPAITFRKRPLPISPITTSGIPGVMSMRAESTMLFAAMRRGGVKIGDFVSVYSKRTRKAVFAIVGDTGNPTGDEGSLHLLQDLGYPFHDGKDDSVSKPEIVIRFYPNSNPKHEFFFTQAVLNKAAAKLGL